MGRRLIHQKRVLELGSGVGLAGIVCQRCGATSCILTDRDYLTMCICLHNQQQNNATAVSVRHFDWQMQSLDGLSSDAVDAEQFGWSDADVQQVRRGDIDVLIGADVLYDYEAIHLLLQRFRELCLIRLNQRRPAPLLVLSNAIHLFFAPQGDESKLDRFSALPPDVKTAIASDRYLAHFVDRHIRSLRLWGDTAEDERLLAAFVEPSVMAGGVCGGGEGGVCVDGWLFGGSDTRVFVMALRLCE
mmetsp:Transcript_38409/g.109793  ORF Transcript_38409/g.109793 Transcript_38409/m.109793 type:complete len:245 (-) Transcript_38409:157-891(-)